MKPKMQQAAESPIGLYVHVPFCRSKCGYCDFYSLTQEDKKEAYVQKVVAEISSYRSSNQRADSLFIGGGTPSLLSEKQLECIVEAC
ncbi:MAG: radical SAM protein, partial [Oscillospiraceae bacterium]